MKYRAIDPAVTQAQADDYWMQQAVGMQAIPPPSWQPKPPPAPIAPESSMLGEVLIVLILVALATGLLALGLWSFA